MIGLLLFKHIYGQPDKGVCERRGHDLEFLQHAFTHERSDLSHWRKRRGDKLELLRTEPLRVAHEAGTLRSQELKHVTVDTTVQPKAITIPTDAELLHAGIKGLNHWREGTGSGPAILCSRGQGRSDDGFPLRSRQTVQAASGTVAHPA